MIKTICFLTTYTCNAKCDFCECGPAVRERIALPDMIKLIDDAVALGTVSVAVFSGGEPTLLGDELLVALGHARKQGLLTRVVTNGWWGTSTAAANAMVEKLLAAGLTEINISIDDLHDKWIPLKHVRNSFLACYEHRLKCLIAHKETKDAKITRAYLTSFFGVDLIDFKHDDTYSEEEQCRLISSSTVIPVGRNEESAQLDNHYYTNWRGSCGSVLRDIIVGAGTNFLPCCGIVTKGLPELTRSDLRRVSLIDAIDEANRDLILNWIALEGPSAIADFVKQKCPEIEFADNYVGICHICNEVLSRHDVRAVLADHLDEIADRIALHRGVFERGRADEVFASTYIRK